MATRPTQTGIIDAGGLTAVLNIGRLAPDGEAYYLSTVAAGVEEYYTGAGEAPGFWLTESATDLGLSGRVAAEDLRAVLGARHPETGEALPRTTRRRVPGFDLAFRAPKSVALVWALGDDATAAVVRDAHDQAVAAAIGYLQRHAAFSRRGRNGIEQVRVAGLVAAAFRHRTSRAGDPLLHTHVLVANLGQCGDGQWRTLHSPSLYAHAKTAGYLYQAALREQLSRRLGVAWTQVRNGTAEIDGVPRPVIKAFSRRRAQILAQLTERRQHSARAAQAATLDTRTAKTAATSLREAWQSRAAALGFGAGELAAVLGVTQAVRPEPTTLAETAEHLAGPGGLTARASTFTRREVLQAWCEQLPAGAGVEEIERLADATLDPAAGLTVPLVAADESAAVDEADPAGGQVDQVVNTLAGRLDPLSADQLRRSTVLRCSVATVLAAGWEPAQVSAALLGRELDSAETPDAVLAWRAERLAARHCHTVRDGLDRAAVIRRADGRVVRADPGERRYSTPELLALEQRLVEQAVARRDAGVGVADDQHLEAAIARRPSIAGEQAAMVARLTRSGAGVDVVVGKAGAGKTYALDAARDAWQASGMRVVGTALAARAAAELEAGAGIDSYTIDALLADVERSPANSGLGAGTVVVVDEAGMVGTRKLARLLDHADAGNAKVVLVGDHRQLPEIDAGGVFRGLLHRLDPVTLHDNRRQHHAWERAALDQLRAGDSATAVAAYADAGQLVVAGTADEVRDRLVADWWTAWTETGPAAGVMIAARVSDVEDLNERARARLHAAGALAGPRVIAGDRAYQQGDRVVALHNDRRLGVLNGTRATVSRVDVDDRSLQVATDDGRDVHVPAGYLQAGHLAHAYAITGHKAQGLTTERGWVLGSDEIYREWGYVALSRGRESNRLYVVAGDASLDADEHCHAPEPARDALAGLAAALDRTRGQALAIDQATANLATPDVAATVDQERLRKLLAAAPPDVERELGWVTEERDTAQDQLAAAQQRLVNAERHLESAQPGRRRRGGREAAEQLRADQQRAASDVGRWQARLKEIGQRAARLEAAADQRDAWLGTHAAEVADTREELDREESAIRRRAQAAEFRIPAYMHEAIGPRPTDPAERRAWRAAAKEIECYRAHHHIDDPQQALGDPPDRSQQHLAHQRALQTIRAVDIARDHVATHDRTDPQQLDLG